MVAKGTYAKYQDLRVGPVEIFESADNGSGPSLGWTMAIFGKIHPSNREVLISHAYYMINQRFGLGVSLNDATEFDETAEEAQERYDRSKRISASASPWSNYPDLAPLMRVRAS